MNLKPPIGELRESGPFPVLRSGTSADQGPRSSMEDAHLQLDRCEELGEWAEGEGRAFYGVSALWLGLVILATGLIVWSTKRPETDEYLQVDFGGWLWM